MIAPVLQFLIIAESVHRSRDAFKDANFNERTKKFVLVISVTIYLTVLHVVKEA